MNWLTEIINRCLRDHLNVMLIGPHGVGKTVRVLDTVKVLGLKLKYFSSATLDPWADLVGIPIPIDAGSDVIGKELKFIRPSDVNDAEMLFFDELNRAHAKVQNAVLEAIQFRTINGTPLPQLKMVWAAINPPNDIYSVNELDPVLTDRFHVFLEVPAQPSVAYYVERTQMPEHIAKALVEWWTEDLDDTLRKAISPRRLEYMGCNLVSGIDLQYSIPPSIKVPLKHLVKRIKGNNMLPFELTRQALVHNQSQIIAAMDMNKDFMLAVADRLAQWPDIMAQCITIFLAVLPEFQAKLLTNQQIKKILLNLAREGRNGNRTLRPLADRLAAMGIRVWSK